MFRPVLLLLALATAALGQQVGLPAPRLLTLFPMGAQAGTTVEATLTGEQIEGATVLEFSHPGLTAIPKPDAPGVFQITVAPGTPAAVYDARVHTRLGISSARAFSVGPGPELIATAPHTSAATALPLPLGAVCNGRLTKRAVDFFALTAAAGQRLIIECAAAGIDSKLSPVLILADSTGRDLLANRVDGLLDYTIPTAGTYLIKLHGLTFQGGPEQFYRLSALAVSAGAPVPRQPATRPVNAFSWTSDPTLPAAQEVEPNNGATPGAVQRVTLPCLLSGAFFPAADVDTFEFTAQKGEAWCIEVASERLGLTTNSFALVQQVTTVNGQEKLTDVAEFDDIPSPVKISTGGYAYDGPPYDAGSADSLGTFTAPADGSYRLSVRDLFGGTRTDASRRYQLAIRPPAPDFALTGWALHMVLRNGDRNALSKPLALRAGATVAFEIVTVRKDGFAGEIELSMEGLPPGLTAAGVKIPAGKNRGLLLITAAADAQPTFGTARVIGRASINGAPVERPCPLASMTWPVRDVVSETPRPRLLADVPVSITTTELAPVSLTTAQPLTVPVGGKLTVPLQVTWRSEFSGSGLKLKALGEPFGAAPEIDVPAQAKTVQAVLDLTALKVPAGEYVLAFHGPSVVKHRHDPAAALEAEAAQQKLGAETTTLAATAQKLAEEAKTAVADRKPEVEQAAQAAAARLKEAETAMATATKRMKAAQQEAEPKDTAEIIVTEPVRVIVQP